LFLAVTASCKSQETSPLILIDSVHRYVYFIDIGKKKINDDGTYSYSITKDFQISSPTELSSNRLLEVIKKRVINDSLNDSVFIDSNSLILDDVQHNDIEAYKRLRPIQEHVVCMKFKSDIGKCYYDKINDIEFCYSVSLVKGKWIELIIGRNLAKNILGRTFLLFNTGSTKCHLFILEKQQIAVHVTDF